MFSPLIFSDNFNIGFIWKMRYVVAYSFQQLQDHDKDNETIDSTISYFNTHQQQHQEQMH